MSLLLVCSMKPHSSLTKSCSVSDKSVYVHWCTPKIPYVTMHRKCSIFMRKWIFRSHVHVVTSTLAHHPGLSYPQSFLAIWSSWHLESCSCHGTNLLCTEWIQVIFQSTLLRITTNQNSPSWTSFELCFKSCFRSLSFRPLNLFIFLAQVSWQLPIEEAPEFKAFSVPNGCIVRIFN